MVQHIKLKEEFQQQIDLLNGLKSYKLYKKIGVLKQENVTQEDFKQLLETLDIFNNLEFNPKHELVESKQGSELVIKHLEFFMPFDNVYTNKDIVTEYKNFATEEFYNKYIKNSTVYEDCLTLLEPVLKEHVAENYPAEEQDAKFYELMFFNTVLLYGHFVENLDKISDVFNFADYKKHVIVNSEIMQDLVGNKPKKTDAELKSKYMFEDFTFKPSKTDKGFSNYVNNEDKIKCWVINKQLKSPLQLHTEKNVVLVPEYIVVAEKSVMFVLDPNKVTEEDMKDLPTVAITHETENMYIEYSLLDI